MKARERTMEGDTSQCQTEYHTRGTPDHNPSPADLIYPFERDEREDEVSSGDNEANGGWLVESYLLEKSRAVIH